MIDDSILKNIREKSFAMFVIGSVLALYIHDDKFRNQVDETVNDGVKISIGGVEFDEYQNSRQKIEIASSNLARQLTDYWFSEDDDDEE